jgi:hypothetical protein
MTANVRKYFYLVSGLLTALIPILVSFKFATPEAGEQWTQLLIVVGGLIGAGGAGTAAIVVAKQNKDGVLDAVTQVNKAVKEQGGAINQGLDDVSAGVRDIPVVGPLASQVIDLFRF